MSSHRLMKLSFWPQWPNWSSEESRIHRQLLEVEGREKGSCFAMTDNAFMTDGTWTEISHKASCVLSFI
jgi:hypothetical protein